MVVCKRCHGYVDTSHTDISNSDPFCVNCGCSYPELNTYSVNKKRKRLRETIRYTGNMPHRKGQLGYITYAQHPNKGNMYPKLIVECPMCTKKSEVITAATNPSMSIQNDYNENTDFRNGYRTAQQSIICPTGHSFRLKVDKEGVYSWI